MKEHVCIQSKTFGYSVDEKLGKSIPTIQSFFWSLSLAECPHLITLGFVTKLTETQFDMWTLGHNFLKLPFINLFINQDQFSNALCFRVIWKNYIFSKQLSNLQRSVILSSRNNILLIQTLLPVKNWIIT